MRTHLAAATAAFCLAAGAALALAPDADDTPPDVVSGHAEHVDIRLVRHPTGR